VQDQRGKLTGVRRQEDGQIDDGGLDEMICVVKPGRRIFVADIRLAVRRCRAAPLDRREREEAGAGKREGILDREKGLDKI